MSRYFVRVTRANGVESYLSHGHEVSSRETATYYPHPSSAWRAAASYNAKVQRRCTDVIDSRTERVLS